jgi:Zn-finger nucleic acid-binding protein
MHAQTLNCYSCGATASTESPACQHCGARLATISCTSCFSMMFLGSKFCPQCGARAVAWSSTPAQMACPTCQTPILQADLNGLILHECGKCFGLWIRTATFDRICHDSEKQSSILGSTHAPESARPLATVRYVRCPECQELMHRVNFSNCSGVVVDVCRQHGTWFDANELRQIVAFIRAGGLLKAREKQKREWAQERRRLEAARRNHLQYQAYACGSHSLEVVDVISVVSAAGKSLWDWLDH